MPKYKWIITTVAVFIIAVAAVMAWQHKAKIAQPSAAFTMPASVPPKTLGPAYVIPPDVSQNMQAALAEREKKLAELSQPSKPAK
jgi:hypothetical protein